MNFRKSHDIGELLQLAEPVARGIAAELTQSDALTMYAVDTRYPGLPPVTRAKAERHVELADRVLAYVRRQLTGYLAAGRPGS